jgi:alpha-L-fucosidase
MPDEDFNKRWHSRVMEVINKYQPDLIYFDNKLDFIDSTYRLDFLSQYYNKALEWDREVVVTYKFQNLKPWAGVLDLERARMSELVDFPWLTDDSVDWGSWCNVQDPAILIFDLRVSSLHIKQVGEYIFFSDRIGYIEKLISAITN